MKHLLCPECVNAVWREEGGTAPYGERSNLFIDLCSTIRCPCLSHLLPSPFFQDGLLPSDLRGIWGSPSRMFLLILPFVFPAQSPCYLSTKVSYLFVALNPVPGYPLGRSLLSPAMFCLWYGLLGGCHLHDLRKRQVWTVDYQVPQYLSTGLTHCLARCKHPSTSQRGMFSMLCRHDFRVETENLRVGTLIVTDL